MKNSILFIIGFTFFITIECIFHALSGKLAYSWITSGVMGGLSLILIDKINDTWLGWDAQLIYQSLIGGTLVTIIEFIIGTLDRVVLHLNMWDYSFVPLNYKGIICVPFSIAWCLLSILAIFIGDAVRYYIFGEEPRPYYYRGTKKIVFRKRP